MQTPRPLPTPAQRVEALAWAGRVVHDVGDYWPGWAWESGDQVDPEAVNRFAGRNLAAAKA